MKLLYSKVPIDTSKITVEPIDELEDPLVIFAAERSMKLRRLRKIAGEGIMFSVGTQIPELLVTAIEELNVESVTETETESCAVENNYSSNSKSVSSERDYQELNDLCKLSEALKYTYILTRPLRHFTQKIRTRFESANNSAAIPDGSNSSKKNSATAKHDADELSPQKQHGECLKPLSGKSNEEQLKYLENIYKKSFLYLHPRFLDPTEGMYWVCNALVDHFYQQIYAGKLFSEDNESSIPAVIEMRREEAAMLRKQRLTGHISKLPFPSTPVKVSSPHSKYLPTDMVTLSGKHDYSHSDNSCQHSGVKSEASSKKKSFATLSLYDRLQLAKREAELENALCTKKIDRKDSDATKSMLRTVQLSPIRSSLSASLLDSSASLQPPQVSHVWQQVPEVERERFSNINGDGEKHGFDNIPTEFTLEYAISIRRQQRDLKKDKEREEQEFRDIKEIEAGKIQTVRELRKKSEKDRLKASINESIDIREKAERERRALMKQQYIETRDEEKRRKEREEKEENRLRDMRSWASVKERRTRKQAEERETMEKIRLKNMADKQEYEEIIRRHKEENRMRYLEGIQRSIENKRMEAEKKVHMALLEKRRIIREEKERVLAKVRLGAFRYHQGHLGFYDRVRDYEPPYIQYEDAWGYAYYLDPITNKSQYEVPNGPIVHHLEKAKNDYDELYGVGAHDALQEEYRWKEQCNIDGGHYENGVWIPLNGYYDENYEFVSAY